MHKTRELEDTPSVRGMIAKIPHLVEIVEERGLSPTRFDSFPLKTGLQPKAGPFYLPFQVS
jgi:hypothetical protein